MEFRSKSVSVEVNLIPQLPPCWIFSESPAPSLVKFKYQPLQNSSDRVLKSRLKKKKKERKTICHKTLEIFRERSTKLFIPSFSFYHDDQPSGSAVSFVLEELGRIRLDERDATKDPTSEEKTARPIGKFYERGGLLVSLASSANTRKVDIRTIKRSVSL